MTKTIEILVSPQGQAQVQTQGFSGAECQQASKFLEQALGRRQSEQLTAEFHQTVDSSQTTSQRQ